MDISKNSSNFKSLISICAGYEQFYEKMDLVIDAMGYSRDMDYEISPQYDGQELYFYFPVEKVRVYVDFELGRKLSIQELADYVAVELNNPLNKISAEDLDTF